MARQVEEFDNKSRAIIFLAIALFAVTISSMAIYALIYGVEGDKLEACSERCDPHPPRLVRGLCYCDQELIKPEEMNGQETLRPV